MNFWLSEKSYKNLLNELKYLENIKIPETIKKLENSRKEGDLSENSGYHAAKDDLSKIKIREKELKNIIKNYKNNIKKNKLNKNNIIQNGKKITININDKKQIFIIGSRENQKYIKENVISLDSPLGENLKGKKEKEEFIFKLPNNKEQKVKILKIENYN